jgi:hypothetical protein
MTPAELLVEGYDRIQEAVHEVVGGLTPDQLTQRPRPDANSIAWLIWHLTRVQDDHVAEVAGRGQRWTEDGWAERLGLALEPNDTGYGHSTEQVAKVRVPSGDLLTGYYDAVHADTLRYLRTVQEGDLDRIVDRRWTPPVTLGVRLVSVLDDDLKHAGQAAYVRGLLGA